MKNLLLENFGVLEMDNKEMNEIHGGLWGLLFGGIAAGLVISAMENYGDIRDGISDAMHNKKYRYQH